MSVAEMTETLKEVVLSNPHGRFESASENMHCNEEKKESRSISLSRGYHPSSLVPHLPTLSPSSLDLLSSSPHAISLLSRLTSKIACGSAVRAQRWSCKETKRKRKKEKKKKQIN